MDDDRKNYFKVSLLTVAAIALLAAAGWSGRLAYRHFKEKHGARQAQAFLARGDYRNAFLSAQQVLLVNATNLQACRVMADLADVSHSPATLDWERRIVETAPTVENKLMLASAGLHYQSAPFPLTAQILGELPGAATNLAAFHVVSAEMALRLNRMADAQSHLEIAARLEPTNKVFAMNLAVVRLGSADPSTAESARATLKQFCADPNFGAAALRSLVADRLVRKDFSGADYYSAQLLVNAQATLGDRLQHLGILKELDGAKLALELKSVQRQSATNAETSAETASWMTANGFATGAADWLAHLPGDIRQQQPVRLALVDCYLAENDWPGLRDYVSRGDWGDAEFLRFAFLSHACDELGDLVVADGNWRAATGEAGERFGALAALLELAEKWQLKSESEDLLWRIVEKFPRERWASHELERNYFLAGDTVKLNRLYSALFAFFPKDAEIENNLAATSLLLRTNLVPAGRWAEEVCAKNPASPTCVSTYAYALHLQGRTRDGVAAMEKLNGGSLEQPSVALYYGVLLAALGENEKASHFLALAKTEDQLLPEEKRLLAEALAAD
jgi:predicted Zn-dependent protease